jgi:hypothetical protein
LSHWYIVLEIIAIIISIGLSFTNKECQGQQEEPIQNHKNNAQPDGILEPASDACVDECVLGTVWYPTLSITGKVVTKVTHPWNLTALDSVVNQDND